MADVVNGLYVTVMSLYEEDDDDVDSVSLGHHMYFQLRMK